jgi:deoxyhypusine synthase
LNYHKIHKILIRADDFRQAEKHVIDFFQKISLINYDSVEISLEKSLPATQTVFWDEIDKSIFANRRVMNEFADELKDSGVKSLDDTLLLTDGYTCKLFHMIAHFLDGLIGIDTVFYNLREDSHWLSETEKFNIQSSPEKYWLIHVKGSFSSLAATSFLHKA